VQRLIWNCADSGIDRERVAAARSLSGVAQRVDAVDERGVSTLEQVDRERPAASARVKSNELHNISTSENPSAI